MTIVLLALCFFAALQLQQWLHNKRVDKLLDRIQAPEKVMAEKQPDGPLLEAVEPDDDIAYWENKGIEWSPEVPH